jgi:hypothetical protein
MLEFRKKAVYEVSGCTCDRCGRRMIPDDPDSEWHERVSIAYHGGFDSIFGDGHAISIDLCQHCVRDTLGAWLRISSTSIYDVEPTPDDLSLSALPGIIRREANDAVSGDAMKAAVEAETPRAQLEAKAIAAIFGGTTWLTAQTVSRQWNPDATDPQAVTRCWLDEGKVFSIEWAGQALYPAYIFDGPGNPLVEVAEILKIFQGYTSFRIASWFESANSMLHGQRPRERLATDPSAVIEAARNHVQGAVHG